MLIRYGRSRTPSHNSNNQTTFSPPRPPRSLPSLPPLPLLSPLSPSLSSPSPLLPSPSLPTSQTPGRSATEVARTSATGNWGSYRLANYHTERPGLSRHFSATRRSFGGCCCCRKTPDHFTELVHFGAFCVTLFHLCFDVILILIFFSLVPFLLYLLYSLFILRIVKICYFVSYPSTFLIFLSKVMWKCINWNWIYPSPSDFFQN